MNKESQARTILFLDLTILLLEAILTVVLIFNPSLVEEFVWKIIKADVSTYAEMKEQLPEEKIEHVVESLSRVFLVFIVLGEIGFAILCSLLYIGVEKQKSRKLTYWIIIFSVLVVIDFIILVYNVRKPQKSFGLMVYGVVGCFLTYRIVAIIVIWYYRKELIQAAYSNNPAAYEVQYSLT